MSYDSSENKFNFDDQEEYLRRERERLRREKEAQEYAEQHQNNHIGQGNTFIPHPFKYNYSADNNTLHEQLQRQQDNINQAKSTYQQQNNTFSTTTTTSSTSSTSNNSSTTGTGGNSASSGGAGNAGQYNTNFASSPSSPPTPPNNNDDSFNPPNPPNPPQTPNSNPPSSTDPNGTQNYGYNVANPLDGQTAYTIARTAYNLESNVKDKGLLPALFTAGGEAMVNLTVNTVWKNQDNYIYTLNRQAATIINHTGAMSQRFARDKEADTYKCAVKSINNDTELQALCGMSTECQDAAIELLNKGFASLDKNKPLPPALQNIRPTAAQEKELRETGKFTIEFKGQTYTLTFHNSQDGANIANNMKTLQMAKDERNNIKHTLGRNNNGLISRNKQADQMGELRQSALHNLKKDEKLAQLKSLNRADVKDYTKILNKQRSDILLDASLSIKQKQDAINAIDESKRKLDKVTTELGYADQENNHKRNANDRYSAKNSFVTKVLGGKDGADAYKGYQVSKRITKTANVTIKTAYRAARGLAFGSVHLVTKAVNLKGFNFSKLNDINLKFQPGKILFGKPIVNKSATIHVFNFKDKTINNKITNTKFGNTVNSFNNKILKRQEYNKEIRQLKAANRKGDARQLKRRHREDNRNKRIERLETRRKMDPNGKAAKKLNKLERRQKKRLARNERKNTAYMWMVAKLTKIRRSKFGRVLGKIGHGFRVAGRVVATPFKIIAAPFKGLYSLRNELNKLLAKLKHNILKYVIIPGAGGLLAIILVATAIIVLVDFITHFASDVADGYDLLYQSLENINYTQLIINDTSTNLAKTYVDVAKKDAYNYYLTSDTGQQQSIWYNADGTVKKSYDWYMEPGLGEIANIYAADMLSTDGSGYLKLDNINANLPQIISMMHMRYNDELDFDSYFTAEAYVYYMWVKNHNVGIPNGLTYDAIIKDPCVILYAEGKTIREDNWDGDTHTLTRPKELCTNVYIHGYTKELNKSINEMRIKTLNTLYGNRGVITTMRKVAQSFMSITGLGDPIDLIDKQNKDEENLLNLQGIFKFDTSTNDNLIAARKAMDCDDFVAVKAGNRLVYEKNGKYYLASNDTETSLNSADNICLKEEHKHTITLLDGTILELKDDELPPINSSIPVNGLGCFTMKLTCDKEEHIHTDAGETLELDCTHTHTDECGAWWCNGCNKVVEQNHVCNGKKEGSYQVYWDDGAKCTHSHSNDEYHWKDKDGNICTKEEHTHNININNDTYIIGNNGTCGNCYTLTLSCDKEAHVHEEWKSDANPGCYYTRYICKGHCGGHITPIINLNMNMTLQELAQEDYFKTTHFLGVEDFKYKDNAGNNYMVSSLMGGTTTLQDWNDYWETMASYWFSPFPSSPLSLISNLAHHYVQGVATYYHYIAEGIRWVSNTLFGGSSDEKDVTNQMLSDDREDVYDWNGWFEIDESNNQFKTYTNSQGVQKFVLSNDAKSEYEDYYYGLVGETYLTFYPDYSSQEMLDEWYDWEVTFPVLGASPLTEDDINEYIESLHLDDVTNNKIRSYLSAVGNYWHSEYDNTNTNGDVQRGRVSFGTWLNSCINKAEGTSYHRTTEEWLKAITSETLNQNNANIGNIFYYDNDNDNTVGFYICIGKYNLIGTDYYKFVSLTEDNDCQINTITGNINKFLKVNK